MDLFVMVVGASGIGDGGENKYNYKVIAWTNEDDPRQTKIVTTNGDPDFREVLHLPQRRAASFLNAELFSVNATDTDRFFIGRANTALPMKTNATVNRKVKLENLDTSGNIVTVGYLEIYMGLETGTIIDNKICHPKNNDFYLYADAGMIGTTSVNRFLVDDVIIIDSLCFYKLDYEVWLPKSVYVLGEDRLYVKLML
ncbi:PREDICTED: uncharacterized protein LOC104788865 [Camelina sativa]|uniref:Uncharacterized protein LOC104788865 n=1 Tax=Camelina sativa TaxID=90675 RepID=A0ABM0ZAX5_CAMSA|nr:PREDICTED: uncharacterized protein LOC104788865 [Camelina sativa]